ncbi:ARM repeat-containing protein [Meredithblackwellia eburnea MCA 4105]
MGGANRFAGLRLEDLQGDMLPLCKDQFGCRYLQKKLEDGNPEHRDMIFNEIFPHFAELMTDPFANYLSQRLLEYSTDEQRDALIESISGELVSISLNMHGTRAVQKMIDYLSTQRQVQSLILALNLNVVTLIKDLNGNHVIQKCLNHLPPEDNQFIYNAVATHCIEVATHRHGCCVLQRCIDHASESQRIQLVTEITYNSLTLVQDAFGNYVVQYVLDLNDNRFIEAIVRQFLGNVSALSAQKFSSNVVEKCIRVADATGRRAIIDELLNKQRLERLLRDSFANYVVQTALDYAEPSQRAQLIETIRPILPMIRNTPYGKRIQSKIQRETHDHHMRGGYHHHMVPNGHYYGMNSMHPPPHYMGHPGHHMGGPQMGGEFGSRGPYMGGYGNQGPPPPPPHMQHHQNPNMPGSGPHQFAPFPMQSMGGLGEYPVNGGMTGMSGMSSHVGLSNGGYGGFM